jgi:hypothetical protein
MKAYLHLAAKQSRRWDLYNHSRYNPTAPAPALETVESSPNMTKKRQTNPEIVGPTGDSRTVILTLP